MEKDDKIFIEKLNEELKDINEKINKLTHERNFLTNIINRNIIQIDKNGSNIRKNSKQKIITQSNILKALSEEKFEKKVSDLFSQCTKGSNISKSSFRNYLSDLNNRSIIEKGSKSGYWKINPIKKINFPEDEYE